MNRFYFSTFNVILLLFAGLSYGSDSNLLNPYLLSYPFKSAIIHYSITNEYVHAKTSKGTEVVYIQGDKLAKVTKIAAPDLKNKGKIKNTETLQLSDPDYLYNIDLVKKIGTKVDNPRKYTMPAYDKLTYEEKKAFYDRMNKRGIVSLNLVGLGKKTGTDTILGRQCDVYESGEKLTQEKLQEAVGNGENPIYMKSWVWKNAVILKVIMSGFGWSNEMIATKIEENVKVPDSQFTVPSDIKVTYDQEKSEFARKESLARFEILKTGKPTVVKVKLKREEIKPNQGSKMSGSNQGSQENQK